MTPYAWDLGKLPPCSNEPGCEPGNHVVNCARSRAFQEQLRDLLERIE
jgi:hypothetical protein